MSSSDELDKLVDWILTADYSPRELQQAIHTKYVSREAVEAAMEELLPVILKRSADKGYVQKLDVERATHELRRELGLGGER